MEIPGLSNNTTENLKQRKIISWAPVDQATEENSGSLNLVDLQHFKDLKVRVGMIAEGY